MICLGTVQTIHCFARILQANSPLLEVLTHFGFLEIEARGEPYPRGLSKPKNLRSSPIFWAHIAEVGDGCSSIPNLLSGWRTLFSESRCVLNGNGVGVV